MRPVFCSERLRTSLLSCPACRGQGSHVWASHLCTYACTHVHTVNVLSPTNLRHPRPEDSKGDGQGGGNGIPGVFPGTGKSLWPSVWFWDALHLTSKRGDTCCILSGGPPHRGSLVIPRKLLSTSHSSLGRFQKARVYRFPGRHWGWLWRWFEKESPKAFTVGVLCWSTSPLRWPAEGSTGWGLLNR